jgi:chromosome segregation ATPase
MADDHEIVGGSGEAKRLREELQAARAEVTRLESDAANAVANSESLRAALADAQARIDSAALDAEEMRGQVTASCERERHAAARYRELVLRAEPALPAEMVVGDTVDAIEASVVAARDVVGRVRSHIEAQTSAARVPAGAPERGGLDVSAMTPQQKIRFGLEQRAQG